ncbi:hypothetical protein SDC9_168066 [bioreactor metagenome]|uniref:Uncharacterized protein n=1 Tax=bioreactor metagenome TaxID=1076179 RepID=A0A645G1H3_9ZZZZ
MLGQRGKVLFRLLVKQGDGILPLGIIYAMIIEIGAGTADNISARQRGDAVVMVIMGEECRIRRGVLLYIFRCCKLIAVDQLIFRDRFAPQRQNTGNEQHGADHYGEQADTDA